MLYYNRIDLRKGIDLIKSKNKECIACHHLYFNHGLKFWPCL